MISLKSLKFSRTHRYENVINYRPRAWYDGKVLLSQVPVRSHPGGGGSNPYPSHNTSTGPMSFLMGAPVTGPRSLPRGDPSPGRGGGTQGQGTSLARDGVPPWDRIADGVLDTQRAYRYAYCVHAGGLSCCNSY